MRRAPRSLALALVGAMLLVGASTAAAQLVPANLRAAILLRALGYERGFAGERDAATLLVIKGSSGEAESDGAAMLSALEDVARASRSGRSVRVAVLEHRDTASTVAAIRERNPAAIYLPRGTYAVAAQLRAERGLVVLCAAPRDMEEGCAVSVELSGGSPRLVINLPQAERAHLRFDARLLGLSRVIR